MCLLKPPCRKLAVPMPPCAGDRPWREPTERSRCLRSPGCPACTALSRVPTDAMGTETSYPPVESQSRINWGLCFTLLCLGRVDRHQSATRTPSNFLPQGSLWMLSAPLTPAETYTQFLPAGASSPVCLQKSLPLSQAQRLPCLLQEAFLSAALDSVDTLADGDNGGGRRYMGNLSLFLKK